MDGMHGSPYAQVPPWAWFMHPGMYQNQNQSTPIPDIIVPARVSKAFEFLHMMNHKQTSRPVAAACDIALELQIIPGQTLTDEEANTVATACNMLTNYFAGKLTPDIWESVKVQAAQKQAETGNIAGRLMHCIACVPGPARPGCPLCHGSGKIMISAVGPATPLNEHSEPSEPGG